MKLPKQFYYKRNRLQQLKGFCYAIQTGSVSEAARKIGLGQSAVTLQIQSLERDLGIKLFKRHKAKIIPTKKGEEFYSHCISCVHQIDSLFENFLKIDKKTEEKIIDIASNHAGISYILPKYLQKFKIKNSDVKFKIRNLSKQECLDRLLSNKIDLFIYPMNVDEIPSEFTFIPIVKYQPILLVKKDHPLAKKKNLTLSDVAKYELVRIDPKLITLPAFEEIIKAHRLKTSFEFEMSDWEILKKFVKADIGVAIISNIILEGDNSGELVGRILTNYFPEMIYGIVVKKGKILDGALKDFINLMTEEKLLQAQKKFTNNITLKI